MFSTKNLAGLVYLINGDLIISFRGTHTKAEELIDSEIELYKYSDGTSIHKGFRNYFLSMSDQIDKILLAEKGNFTNIYITGHSLGASAALVCAWSLLQKKVTEPINMVTFACPKTGNKQFVEYLQNNLKGITNIVNYFDIVPESPEIFGKLYSIKPIYIFGIETDSDIKSHSIPIYNQGLSIMTLLNEST
jgi:predicted lipase